ncbi:hypothetical protein [Chitinophaga sp. Cy-1792]|uniref:hypothetical protein n=1 Tax=Chitinophaga sp. Cy-1792 TaxID=2608339 RepID=UPI0014209534|nr:hypothetical protein [Chitinophaga sp. Cy-1792]NIG52055.1 hypothetical protein [Chitinophaga sp. Cy-1792]
MSVYKISSEGIKAQRWTQIRTLVLIGIIVMAILWYMGEHTGFVSGSGLIVPVVVMIAYISVSSYLRMRKVNEALRTFEIEITDQTIIRRQRYAQEMSFSRFEITNMAETANGIIVRGEGQGAAMLIPNTIEDYDQLVEELKRIHPFDEEDTKTFQEKFRYLGIVLLFGGIAGYAYFENKYLSILSICLLLAFLWLFAKPAYQSRLFSEERRKRAAWVIYIITIVLTGAIVLKLLSYI